MTKRYIRNGNYFIINDDTILKSFIKDALSISLLILLAYVNYTYIGNTWYIGVFIVFIIIGIVYKYHSTEISKKVLLKYLNKEENKND